MIPEFDWNRQRPDLRIRERINSARRGDLSETLFLATRELAPRL